MTDSKTLQCCWFNKYIERISSFEVKLEFNTNNIVYCKCYLNSAWSTPALIPSVVYMKLELDLAATALPGNLKLNLKLRAANLTPPKVKTGGYSHG